MRGVVSVGADDPFVFFVRAIRLQIEDDEHRRSLEASWSFHLRTWFCRVLWQLVHYSEVFSLNVDLSIIMEQSR